MRPKSIQPNLRQLSQWEIDRLAEAIVKRIGRPDEILTSGQVAEMLGITEIAVRARCRRSQIPYHRKHGQLYFSKNELTDYYLSEETEKNTNTPP